MFVHGLIYILHLPSHFLSTRKHSSQGIFDHVVTCNLIGQHVLSPSNSLPSTLGNIPRIYSPSLPSTRPQSSIIFANATIYPLQSFKVLDIPEPQKSLQRRSVPSCQEFDPRVSESSIYACFTRPNTTFTLKGSNRTVFLLAMAGLPSNGSPAARGRVSTTRFAVHDEADYQDSSTSSRLANSVRSQPLASRPAY